MSDKRGRKPLERTDLHVRVDPKTPSMLRKKAQKLGYIYGDSGATGELLDAIAQGKLALIPQEKWELFTKVVTIFKTEELQ